jgi:DNA primase
VICFDGDRAGEAAAARAIDRMLPVLREGRSFRFAFLPEGSDPDDLVRIKGADALKSCLGAARPLIDVLWVRELKTHSIDTPERRAAFEARLEDLLAQIGNARVRDHYRREVKNRLFNLWREQGALRGKKRASPVARPAGSATPPPMPSAYGFAIVITLALANHPWLLDRFAEEVASLEIREKRLAALLAAVTRLIFEDHAITGERLAERLAEHPEGKLFDKLLRESAFKRVTFLQPDTPRPEVEQHFADLIFRFRALPNLTRELAEHADQLAEVSEDEFERFAQLRLQVASIGQHHETDDAGDRDAAKRFQETVARLKREHADAHRRRRPEKHD